MGKLTVSEAERRVREGVYNWIQSQRPLDLEFDALQTEPARHPETTRKQFNHQTFDNVPGTMDTVLRARRTIQPSNV